MAIDCPSERAPLSPQPKRRRRMSPLSTDRAKGIPNMSTPSYRQRSGPMRWREVDVLEYKREGSAPFQDVTRQVLFDDPALGCQLRYFEVAPGGHTTLERHEHAHAVIIERG